MARLVHRTDTGLRSTGGARRTRSPAIRGRREGQALVEFSLVIPLFVVLLVGIIEFAFALNAVLSIGFATREAALIAAEAGNGDGADCMILSKIDASISAPSTDGKISNVLIFKADRNGNRLATNTYLRAGTMTCDFAGGVSVTVPYSLSGGENYPDTKRCNALAGCEANPPLPATGAVDLVGVEVRYEYSWRTPLASLLTLSGSGYTIVNSSSMRMEPIL
jgi:Flp pilus assembly protein TadG